MTKEDVSKALAEARALVTALESHDGSAQSHLNLLNQASNVRTALEGPYDTATRWLECLSITGALYLLIRLKALQKLPAEGSISAQTLADQCNVDVSAINRAMRVLLVNGVAVETAPDEYAHNDLSLALQPEGLGQFLCISVDFMRDWCAFPDYAKTHAPEDLFDAKKSLHAFMLGKEGKTFYEIIDENTEERHLFNITMQAMEKNFPITGLFPFKSLEAQVSSEPERPFIVDIGGGRGQALLALKEDCGGAFGSKLVLQDLPSVIDSLSPEDIPGIQPMKYDASTPQPIKNAHVYLMRRFLHDFYDPVCEVFLRNTVSAMGPDSRLIVCDMIIPEKVQDKGEQTAYWLDFCLMCMSGKERKLGEFEALFDRVGLELVAVHKAEMGHVAMLETRLKRS
ncbi:hypothetical protein S40288_03665 [Stachybotrys chartarum IBT 40288]|nr:hypothetical protein S40288_03665 [Stachybotrys chartarum IBT 40288]